MVKMMGLEGKKSKRQRRVAWLDRIGYVSVVVFILVLAFLSYNALLHPPQSNQKSSLTAAIVDQLSLTQPNPNFKETFTDILEEANFTVDYYAGDRVTVDFYRNLPSQGYDLIVLRVHSALLVEKGQYTDRCTFFTSELYRQGKYFLDEYNERVVPVMYFHGGTTYFGVSPEFVRSSMKGRFNNTIVIMMGCNGLTGIQMAEAFVEKGAKAYIGWDEHVSADHTD